ncbi:hypothetical protein C8A05DRAFT_19830 [Staphylotrichum tortipilum]|uniref:DUF7136 domain-containing protein n=1 Tax=Staphylotrichum tortipilum TaxID=2831512 RepID=A0AAN6MCE4_9PEZI|nr:hypothetical protein C8A05DRAFT_19830 [Staphylotrichum longicolle]
MPALGSSPLHLFGHALLGLLALKWCVVQAAGGIVEVDLVFPRNETYRLGNIPILFAVRNSPLAVPLTMDIMWTVWETSPNMLLTDSGIRELHCDELGKTDPFFTVERANPAKTTDAEATWVLLWDVLAHNCTATGASPGIGQLTTQHQQQLTFTTKKGAQEPDLLQGTAACARSPGITFNVTDTRSIAARLNYGRASCNVLAQGDPPAADVCALDLGPAVAATMAGSPMHPHWCSSAISTTSPTPSTNAAAPAAPAAHVAGLVWLAFLASLVGMMV